MDASLTEDGAKKIYLTIDEGYEYGTTASMLDTLQEKGVKATFFVTLPYAQSEPDLIRRIGRRLFTTHLHDNFGLRDDHQGAGLGYIDWRGVIPAILETGYRGPLMMELTGRRCAAARDVPEMRRLSLEKELIFASSYLNYTLRQYENAAAQSQRKEKGA